ncbi:hypothetical protein Q8A67_005666 [Cirrhinus molitorella]|uniref:Immunoglobulin subtype domain-containing protein n=1 Tax=Cirrhinus molitorella TaxID=172907 RepID=A0AA88Q0R7_9TELE|nr:hypothetical protein Q8A67_005666 [Cirrhinus molitorella]
MVGRYIVLILFAFLVDGVFGATDEVKSVMKGDSVTLNSAVTKEEHETMRWYFSNIRIALINGDPSKNCLYDGPDGIFKGRLEVDHRTGSLTITNTIPEHSGRYEAEIIKIDGSGNTHSLKQNRKCNSTKITLKSGNIGETINIFSLTVSATFRDKNKYEPQKAPQDQETDRNSDQSTAVVGAICGGVLVVAATGVVIYRQHRSFKKDMNKNKEEVLGALNEEMEKDGGPMI